MTDPYQQLARYLDSLPAGYPATSSAVELRILRKLFTPAEAQLALQLTLLAEESRVVAYRARQPLQQVKVMLDGMADKGLISANHPPAGKPRLYAINQFVIGFYEDQVNRLDRELVDLLEEYSPEFMEKGPWKIQPQLRTIPVNESIPITSEVMPYESAAAILRSKEAFAVRPCVCRQERQVLGHDCGKPMDVCLTFDGAARNTAASGKGRLISFEEALDILEQARHNGLVVQPANSKNPVGMCLCCGCCCGVLRHIKKQPRPADLVANAFTARHDPELCSACGACLDVCPMTALVEEDGIVLHIPERCIGCGLCVEACPNDALAMVRKAEHEQPSIPRNTAETYIRLGLKRGTWNLLELAGMVFKSYRDRLFAPRQ